MSDIHADGKEKIRKALADEIHAQLAFVINHASLENGSNTPDYILAKYLQGCLAIFDSTVRERDRWYGIEPRPGWRP